MLRILCIATFVSLVSALVSLDLRVVSSNYSSYLANSSRTSVCTGTLGSQFWPNTSVECFFSHVVSPETQRPVTTGSFATCTDSCESPNYASVESSKLTTSSLQSSPSHRGDDYPSQRGRLYLGNVNTTKARTSDQIPTTSGDASTSNYSTQPARTHANTNQTTASLLSKQFIPVVPPSKGTLINVIHTTSTLLAKPVRPVLNTSTNQTFRTHVRSNATITSSVPLANWTTSALFNNTRNQTLFRPSFNTTVRRVANATRTGRLRERPAYKPGIFAHFMMANTYGYTHGQGGFASAQDAFAWDIRYAKEAGLTGFVLNIGNVHAEPWQLDGLDAMYKAAESLGGFKLFLSIDFATFPRDAGTVVQTIARKAKSVAQYLIRGNVAVTTFLGQDVTFGESSVDEGWNRKIRPALADMGIIIFFMPFFPEDANGIYERHPTIEGFTKWNAWPYFVDEPVSDFEDRIYKSGADKHGNRGYMATVSPWFFTHFSWKNWIFRSEDTWHTRWKQLIGKDYDFVQVLTWNDWGESHYIGPVNPATAYPFGSEQWVRNMDHKAFFDQLKYYSRSFLARKMLPIEKSKIFLYHRPHPKSVVATNDPLPPPASASYSRDVFVVEGFLNKPTTATLKVGGKTIQTLQLPSGISYHEVQFPNFGGPVLLEAPGCRIASTSFSTRTEICNFNAMTDYCTL